MATALNISLPETLKEFVDEQVRLGGYQNASEYLRLLVRRDQLERSQSRLEELLLEGVESGEPIPVTTQYWADLRGELAARRGAPKKG